MRTLLLASKNQHKIQELRELILPLGVKLLSALDLDLPEVEETEDSLEGNARLKAKAVYEATNIPCISDDTGLEVDILKGQPGVRSARYAGENATYEENVALLLKKLEHSSGTFPFKAQFRTSMCFWDGTPTYFEGVCQGVIVAKSRGDAGFGYDPIFVPDGYNQTFSELDSGTKNKISHRGKATQNFLDWLKKHYQA